MNFSKFSERRANLLLSAGKLLNLFNFFRIRRSFVTSLAIGLMMILFCNLRTYSQAPVLIAGNNPICASAGQSATLSATYQIGGSIVYLYYYWQVSNDNTNWQNLATDNSGSPYTATLNELPVLPQYGGLFYRYLVSYETVVTTYYSCNCDTWGCGTCSYNTYYPGNYTSGSYMIAAGAVAGSISGGGTTVCSGNNNSVLILYGSLGNIQWQSSTDGVNFNNINGAAGQTYAASGLTVNTYYQAIITNGTCSATTQKTLITVAPNPIAGMITGATPVCAGTNSTTLTLNGYAGNVQWQSSTDNQSFSDIQGETGSSISINNLITTTYYQAVVSGGFCGSAVSPSVVVTVSPVSVAGMISGAGTVCADINSSFLTLSGNTGTIQWQSSLDNNIFTDLPGANSVNYAPSNLTTTTYYQAVSSSGICPAFTSPAVAMIVNPAPVAGMITGTHSVCPGNNNILLSLSGSLGNIQWQSSPDNSLFTNISGETGSIYSASNLQATTYYQAVVSNGVCQPVTSPSLTVTVYDLPTPYLVTGGGTYCSGGLGLHIGLQNSQSGMTYQVFNGTTASSESVAGNTGSQLDFGVFQSGTYTIVAANEGGCTNNMTGSATISLTPTPATFNLIAPSGVNDCSGSGVDLQLSGSETGVSYQLFVNDIAIGSPIDGTGSPIDLGNKSPGNYSILGTSNTGGCNGNMSTSITVNNGAKPTSYSVTGGGDYCSGPGLPIGLSNSETGVQYELMLNGASVGSATGSTGNSITFGNQTAQGSYSVLATNTSTQCTNTMLNNVTINAGSAPATFDVQGSGSYCSNGSGVQVSLSSSENGITYQLLSNGGNTGVVAGGNGGPLDFGFQTAGVYTVFATNTMSGCTSTMNGSAMITLNNIVPAIITQPLASQTICAGNSVSFSVTASDDATGFQWMKNSTEIPGANGSSYSIPSVSSTDQANYSVVVKGSCVNTISNNAALIVNPVVTITTQPLSQSFCGSVMLQVGAGNATGYQWYLGESMIGGATGATYTATTAGSYTVVVSGSCGSPVTSTVALLTANSSVAITSQPQDKAICNGGSATFSVVAGNASQYQWFRGNNSISGAISATYTTSVAGSYKVVVSGSCGAPVTSNTVLLSMNPAVTIVSQPVSNSICVGGTQVFSVVANNATGYQWYKNLSSIAGANSAQYSTGSAGVYQVKVTGICGNSVLSNPAILTYYGPAVITKQPQSQAICSGGLATFSVNAINATTYQWYRNNSAISGAISNSYTTNVTGSYVVKVNGCGGSATSNPAVLSLLPPPNVASIAGSASICVNNSVKFSDATNGGTWSTSDGTIATVTSSGLVKGIKGGTASILYTVSNGCASKAVTKTIIVNSIPTVTTINGNSSVCPGSNIQLTDITPGGNWSTSNSSIATVNNSGLVRGMRNGNVVISYTVSNNCGSQTATTRIAVTCPIQKNSLGVQEEIQSPLTLNVTVSPNPSQSTFTLTTQSSVDGVPVNIMVFDMSSRLLESHVAGVGEAVRFGDRLAAGMYIIRVTQGTVQKVVKVIKN